MTAHCNLLGKLELSEVPPAPRNVRQLKANATQWVACVHGASGTHQVGEREKEH